MSLDHLSVLAGRVRSSDPLDGRAQAQNLDLLCELSAFVQSRGSPEIAACLLAAAHALQALAGGDAGLPRADVHRSACALLEAVQQALAGPAAAAAPAPALRQAAAARRVDREREGRLGRMLLRLGHITRAQLARALLLHRAKRLPIGECLLLLGACAPDLVLEAMKAQTEIRNGGRGKPPSRAPEPAAPARGQAPARATAAFHVTKDMFLGEVLLGVGMITNEELEQAMHLHHHLGLKVGAALVRIGALTEEEVQRGLELQRRLQSIATVKARP